MKNVNLVQPIADLDGNPIVFGENEILDNGQVRKQPYGKTYAKLAEETIATLKLKTEEDNKFAYRLLNILHSATNATEYTNEELIFMKRNVFNFQPVIVRCQYDELINFIQDEIID